jgi:putative ATP-dependent DNA ligase
MDADILERLCNIYPFKDRSREIWQDAISSRRVREEVYDGIDLLRLDKTVHGLKRGTILSEDGVVMDYPRIMRVLHLGNGIRRNLKGPFFVEEKVDGYNVRLSMAKGKVLAFSRGGFICPFATDRAEDFIDEGFFRDHPDLVLCCEVAGPDTPYSTESPPYIKEDCRFLVFDIMEKGSGSLIPLEEKYELLRRYGLPGVRVFGSFPPEEWEKVKGIVRALCEEGCEGIVMKPLGGRKKTIKYVTPFAHMRDIKLGSLLMEELPAGYFMKRVEMFALSARELGAGLRPEELGESLLNPFMEAISRMEREEGIKETFTIRARREETLDSLFRHIRASGVDVDLLSKERVGDYWKATFTRSYRKAEGFLKAALKGSTFLD